jgi:glycosyltransferase involved in cell wall biosynthesis
MRIAQVAPLFERVPPRLYGGTERIVHYLTEELVRQGHQVTLFASGDSVTSAHLVPLCRRALRLDGACDDPVARHVAALERMAARRHDFDIVHFHTDYLHFPLARHLGIPNLSTLHGRLDIPALQPLYAEYRDMPVVSISDAQRRPLPHARWLGTVYHGLPLDLLPFHPHPGDYFAFLGRLSREKRPDRAIAIATALKVPLKLAAKVDAADRAYFDENLAHLIDPPRIEHIGEIGDDDKAAFIGNARALLFPVDWPEPFGLVMIEAMACGTPVIAFRCGSVPEVMIDGVTGFVVDTVEEAIAAAARVDTLDRRAIRHIFETRFSARRMVRDYLDIYPLVMRAQPPLLASGSLVESS